MRIAVCGINIESSTFTEHVTTLDDFIVHRGDEVLQANPVADWAPEVELVGLITADCVAAGPIRPDVYDAIEDEMAERLAAAGTVDGVWIAMHGAMVVQGRDRAEERWVRRIRSIVGPDVVISGSFDSHGNLSAELVELIDLAAFHRHAPHIDNALTRERAVKNLVAVLERGERPHKAYVRVPMLLPGERTATTVEPGKSVFAKQLDAIADFDLIDAAMTVGFFWADEARNSAAVLTTAWNQNDALNAAASLAAEYWAQRDRFQLVADQAGSWSEALDFALTRPPRPLFISDSGDNVTAGGTGDITFALAATISHEAVIASGLKVLFAGVWDPATVIAAAGVGVGVNLNRSIGAALDNRYAPAVDGPWKVEEIIVDQNRQPVQALLRGRGVYVHISADRKAFTRNDDPGYPGVLGGPDRIAIDDYDVVVVKNGYLFPAQADDSGSHFMALTPGGTDLVYERLEFTAIVHPMYPWDSSFDPDLVPRLIRALNAG